MARTPFRDRPNVLRLTWAEMTVVERSLSVLSPVCIVVLGIGLLQDWPPPFAVVASLLNAGIILVLRLVAYRHARALGRF